MFLASQSPALLGFFGLAVGAPTTVVGARYAAWVLHRGYERRHAPWLILAALVLAGAAMAYQATRTVPASTPWLVGADLVWLAIVLGVLLAATITDLRERTVEVTSLAVAVVITLVHAALYGWQYAETSALGIVIVGVPFLLMWLGGKLVARRLYRGGLPEEGIEDGPPQEAFGFGDVVFGAFMGAVLGPAGLDALFVAFLLIGFVAVGLLLIRFVTGRSAAYLSLVPALAFVTLVGFASHTDWMLLLRAI